MVSACPTWLTKPRFAQFDFRVHSAQADHLAGFAQRVWPNCAWKVFDQMGHMNSEDLRITSYPSQALEAPCNALLWCKTATLPLGMLPKMEAMLQEDGKLLSHRQRSCS